MKMRYAIISDIHGNLEALKTVLADIEKQNADKIICLGDVVGYGPAPNECVELVRKHADICLMGNHDFAAVGKEPLEYFNAYARDAILWTRRALTEESLQYLSERPFMYIEDDLTFVHSSPYRPEEWLYILSARDAASQFDHLQTEICFIGHSHVAIGFARRDSDFWLLMDPENHLNEGARYIINVGAVGQPRDNDPRASYGIYDADAREFVFRRLEYDVQATQKQMEKLGLPRYLIDRLQVGR